MVCRLVKHYKRRFAQQNFSQGDPHLPAPRKFRTRPRHVGLGKPQPRQYSLDFRAQLGLLHVFQAPLKLAHCLYRLGIFARLRIGRRNDFFYLRKLPARRYNVDKRRFRLFVEGTRTGYYGLLRKVPDSRVFGLCYFAGIRLLDAR